MTVYKKSKKILIIHCFYRIKSGESVIIFNELELLKANGFNVELLTFSNSDFFFKTFIDLLLAPFNPISFFKVLKKIKLFKPDIVHIHNWHFNLSPSVFIACKLLGVKIIYSLHNFRLLCPSGTLFFKNKLFLNSINKRIPFKAIWCKVYRNSFFLTAWLSFVTRLHYFIGTWSKVDMFVVNSEFAKELFINSYLKINLNKIVVKPNFNFYDDTPVSLIRNENYLFSGRISEEKGIPFLLEAAATMGFKLVVIGEGNLAELVKKFASNYSNIIYLGRQPRSVVLEELRKCKALIFPSLWYEGMPLSIIEALQVGTPVISSRIGVMPEMIDHNINGILFNTHDTGDFIEKINFWESMSTYKREKFYLAARNKFLNSYTPQKNMEHFFELYDIAPHFSKVYS